MSRPLALTDINHCTFNDFVLSYNEGLLILLLLCLVYNETVSSAGVGINMTEPCQYPVPVGLEKDYIPDSNIWVTSQINAIRGAKYGRLRGWRGMCVVNIFSTIWKSFYYL